MGRTSMPVLAMEPDGAALHHGAALPILPELEAVLGATQALPGVRLAGNPALASLLATGVIHDIMTAYRRDAVPVRAVLFDKSPTANWALGWHQDRTIPVCERIDTPGFGPWTRKAGLLHVEPPFTIIERMVTLRIHLDDVPADNAPLLVARGSHRMGRIESDRIDAVVAGLSVVACIARRGDIWAYATAIVHASDRAHGVGRRRVLQIDCSADALPGGLAWLGLGAQPALRSSQAAAVDPRRPID